MGREKAPLTRAERYLTARCHQRHGHYNEGRATRHSDAQGFAGEDLVQPYRYCWFRPR